MSGPRLCPPSEAEALENPAREIALDLGSPIREALTSDVVGKYLIQLAEIVARQHAVIVCLIDGGIPRSSTEHMEAWEMLRGKPGSGA